MHFIVQMNWQFLQNKEHSYFIYIHTEKFTKMLKMHILYVQI